MRRWIVVPVVLAVYGLVLYLVLTFFFFILIADEELSWSDLSDWWNDIFTENELAVFFGGMVLAFMISQTILLWPVRRPTGGTVDSGRPIWLSVPVLGLAAGFLSMGILAAGLEAAITFNWWDNGSLEDLINNIFWIVAGSSWVIWTILIWIFIRGVNRESVLHRWLVLLFAGSVIEAALIIPLDIVVRRRTDCYCGTGTFWSLYFCGGIGLWTMGPLAVLMLLIRHRRPLYTNSCPHCGYAKGPVRNRPRRCPECGVSWQKSGSEADKSTN